MNYDKLFDDILKEFSGPKHLDELAAAKTFFFENSGVLNDESAEFELRMAQFLDWYIYTRELLEYDMSPVELLKYEHQKKENREDDWEERQKILESLVNHQHSLYQYIKNKKQDIYIQDLLSGTKVIVKDAKIDLSFHQEEIFEARILSFNDQLIFAKGFCFHPVETRKFILGEIKKVKKQGALEQQTLILRLLKMRYKHEQYQHIKLDYIYTNEPKLKF